MNFDQLKEKLEEIGVDDIANGDYDAELLEGELEEVHSEGDYEGGGEYAEKVFKYVSEEEGDIYFRITGCYSSYDGTDWDSDFGRVYPKQVMVTQYVSQDQIADGE